MLAGIDCVGEKFPRVVAALSRIRERDVWIDSQREPLFLAAEAVLESPELRTTGGNFQIQPAAIEQTHGFIGWLCLADGRIGEWHFGGILLWKRPDAPYYAPKCPRITVGKPERFWTRKRPIYL